MRLKWYLCAALALLAISCKEPEPEPTPTPQPVEGKITIKGDSSVVLSDEGDSKQVAFSATLKWTAVSSESWLTVLPATGEAGEDLAVTLKAVANSSYDVRTATVTLKCDKDSKTIQVAQKQKGALILAKNSFTVGAQGGSVDITAKANADVKATVDAAAAGWIKDVTTKGLVDYEFNFEISANPGEEPRSGKIVFSNSYASETVTIQQEANEGPSGDFNVFGKVTCDGEGVPDVLISDGIEIVKTNAQGNYQLLSGKKWRYVFMITPSGYEPAALGFLPKIHEPLTADVNTPEEVNFTLEKSQNDNYTLLVCGDMHLARRTNDLAQFEKVAGFMNQAIAEAPGKVYCLTLGDMTWDMYWIANNYGFSDYIQTMNSYFPSTTFFHTMGNHDNEMEVAGDFDKALKYTENLTPDYYSFNLGKVHYIVMDNMDFTGVEAGQENRSKYAKNFTAEQLAWLKKDLSYVDKSTPIFVTAHEPLARPSGLDWNEQLDGKDADLNTFIGIFDGYNVRYLSGHTHNLFNRNWTSTFVEHNSGAICASWWWSGYHTPGIHIAQDGAPGGFTVWDVKGTEFTHYYQAALQPREYQFRAYDMNKVKEVISEDRSTAAGYPKYYNHIQSYGDNVILVNVWDYDDDWTVEISENGTPLSVSEVGVYDPLHIEAMTIPRLNKNDGTTTFSTAKWRHFFQATASAADTPVTVKVTDRYGNVYTEEMTRPKPFTVDDYKNETVRIKPEAKFVFSSSSSLIFGWTIGGTAAEDAEAPYKLELFKDAACTDLQVSFDVPAGHSCWSGNALRFAFGGLQPATKYWFKVTNSKNGDASDPVEGETEEFTVVDPATVTNAGVGDVILAEDFSEIAWGPDEEHVAAGVFPVEKLLEPITGAGEHDVAFQNYKSTSRRVYGDTKVTSDKRLYNWGFFGNSSVYAYNGHLRVCTTDSGARTHIVSPALSGIPEGKTATVDVTVTACPTFAENDVAVFVDDHSSLKLVLAPDQKESTNPKFSSQGGKYTGVSLTNGYALNVPSKKLTTSTVRIEGVTSNSCLIIGSYENVDKKNRFWLSDVKVQIVSLGEVSDIQASFVSKSSSTAVFSWTAGASAADDVSRAYTATLYKDSACTVVDQSFDFPADLGAWNGKQPKYVFGGLEPSTDYWFKVKDTTNNLESNVVKVTTDSFTVVEMPESITEPGVVLAEDFGEIRWEFDLISSAAGFRPSDNSSFANTGVNTDENNSGSYIYGGYHRSNAGGELTFKGQDNAIKNSRLKNWLTDTNVYIHPGYLKLGTTSSRGWILTPEFTVPYGKKAIVTVTVSGARINSSQDSKWAVLVLTPELAKADPGAHTADFAWPDDTDETVYQEVSITSTDSWETRTVSGLVVNPGDRIAFGGIHNGDSKKGRVQISDITVTVTAIEDANRTTKVSVIGDSISTFKGWCDTTKGGAYYPKNDCDVSSVTDTWWHKLIYTKMSTGIYEKNISAGNTTVVQNTTGDSGAYWYGWDFGTRLQQLGIGNPDVVLIYGGTNDYGHISWYSTSEELIDGVNMRAASFPDGSKAKLEELLADADAASTVDEADALDGKTFCSAYIRLIRMIKARHPQAKVVCVIGDYLSNGMAEAVNLIADHWDDVRAVDILAEVGFGGIPKYASPHPNAAGMEKIANFVYQEVGAWIDQE